MSETAGSKADLPCPSCRSTQVKVALNTAAALTPEQLKQQTARLKRAAKRTPLVISAATGAGVPAAMRALQRVIDEARGDAQPPAAAAGWHP